MKGCFVLFGVALSICLLSGCASAPKTSNYARTAPPLAEGRGRIWFYALKRGGVEFDPAVHVNYATVGAVQKYKCFYKDFPPGNYLVECTTEWRGTCQVKLFAGETKYVRFMPHMGLWEPHIQPTEIDPATAMDELSRCDAANLTPASLSGQDRNREQELLQNLASPNETKVFDSLAELEKKFPADTNVWVAIKPLLRDSRAKVRRKAARVLGAVRADVSADDVNAICAMLEASDPDEQADALKSLRGLRLPGTASRIIPLLKSSDPGVIRDACRALAVVGDKGTIVTIEPLLQHRDKDVQRDAKDAIFQLERKPPDTREVKNAI